jgi:hypothetical protein
MGAGVISLHKVINTSNLGYDTSIWLMKLIKNEWVTEDKAVHFYDGSLIGFHACFSNGLTEIQMKNCLDKPDDALYQ